MDALTASTIALDVVRKLAIEGVDGVACDLTIRGLERARNGVAIMVVALHEIAARYPEGHATRYLASQALHQAGFTLDPLPMHGRQVTLRSAS